MLGGIGGKNEQSRVAGKTVLVWFYQPIGSDGKLIFDFPSIDETGAPMDYFFGVEDPQVHEVRVLRPRIGRTDQTLADYNVKNGDTVFLVPDPFPG